MLPNATVHLFATDALVADRAGFVLNSDVAVVLCACAGDCNSNTRGKGHRGCDPTPCCDHRDERCPVWQNHDCTYPPAQLFDAMESQINGQQNCDQQNCNPSHNEVVIDNLAAQAHMPAAISAFFYTSSKSRADAAKYHANFLAAFPQISEADCPLLKLDLRAEHGRPVFSRG